MEYQVFSTGDQIWTSIRHGKRVTVKLLTHDGLSWEEGEENSHRLTGVELWVHKATVFCIKIIHKLTN